MDTENDWIKWGEWVKDGIKTCKMDIAKIELDIVNILELVTNLRLDHRTIQVKSGIWGILGSLGTIIGGVLILFLKEHYFTKP
jgi:hypothetical protein